MWPGRVKKKLAPRSRLSADDGAANPRHQEAMFEATIHAFARPNKSPVFRTNSLEHKLKCRWGCWWEFEYAKPLVRPVDFPAQNVPEDAAGVAYSLSLGQISITLLQPLYATARTSSRSGVRIVHSVERLTPPELQSISPEYDREKVCRSEFRWSGSASIVQP